MVNSLQSLGYFNPFKLEDFIVEKDGYKLIIKSEQKKMCVTFNFDFGENYPNEIPSKMHLVNTDQNSRAGIELQHLEDQIKISAQNQYLGMPMIFSIYTEIKEKLDEMENDPSNFLFDQKENLFKDVKLINLKLPKMNPNNSNNKIFKHLLKISTKFPFKKVTKWENEKIFQKMRWRQISKLAHFNNKNVHAAFFLDNKIIYGNNIYSIIEDSYDRLENKTRHLTGYTA